MNESETNQPPRGVRPLPGPVEPQSVVLALRPEESWLLCAHGVGDTIGHGAGNAGRALAGRWATSPTVDRSSRTSTPVGEPSTTTEGRLPFRVSPDATLAPPVGGSAPQPSDHQRRLVAALRRAPRHRRGSAGPSPGTSVTVHFAPFPSQ